ncbi:hypothetical protein OOT46_14525 [Aquabacterium sp. A7-Y]|uniref:YfaP family protein n=1 Tax=Aquabacterium sp. A7-Y TaxID=1349605 RepID=UPI00223E1AB4|nr:hypothetical protein [Aquabacterium sp. A7-Y]MCW7539056.1 hypothetical protein [Aquabacterium sp. A7-Y]
MSKFEAEGILRRLALAAGVVATASCGGGGGSAGASLYACPGKGLSPIAGEPQTTCVASGGSDGARPTPDATVQISTAAIQGSVVSAESGAAIEAAAVSFGDVNLSTDASGFFSQASYDPIGRLIQQASKEGFESQFLATAVVAAVPSVTLFKLTPHGTTAAVTTGSASQLTSGAGPASASIPAGSLSANASVRLSPVAVGADSFALSGDYTSSTGEPLQSYGAVVLSADPAVTISGTDPVTLRVPVSTKAASNPATANIYYLDTTTGRWVQDGTATLGSGASGSYYEATVTRFGQWMVGAALQSPVLVNGCMVDDAGAPVAGGRVWVEGVNYSGLAFGQTSDSGAFSLPVPQNSQLVVTGRRGVYQSNAVLTSVSTANLNLTPCLTVPLINAATVRLTWGASPRDIDSHLHIPGGAKVDYTAKGSLSTEPYSSLDVDDISGFGPEITTVRRPKVGIYRFYLHNFSQQTSPGMTESPARVELNYAGRTVIFSPPAGEGDNHYLHVFDLEIGANCSMTLYRYNRWRSDPPRNPNSGGTAQACVPN